MSTELKRSVYLWRVKGDASADSQVTEGERDQFEVFGGRMNPPTFWEVHAYEPFSMAIEHEAALKALDLLRHRVLGAHEEQHQREHFWMAIEHYQAALIVLGGESENLLAVYGIPTEQLPVGIRGSNPPANRLGESRGAFLGPSADEPCMFTQVKHLSEGPPTPSESVDASLRGYLDQLTYRYRVAALSVSRLDAKASWEKLNQRRLTLIGKDIERGLSAAEKVELDDLEKRAEEYMNRVAPVPFGIIERLKACAVKDGLNVSID